MHMLPVPSATFDERLIQRSGSGETDNTSSNAESGLATPQDEGVLPPLGLLDLKQAVVAIERKVVKTGSTESGKEDQWDGNGLNSNGSGEVISVKTPVMSKMISSASGSSVAQSPEFEDPRVTHAKTKGMYTLPNRHISIEMQKDEVAKYSDDDDFRVEDYTEPSQGLLQTLLDTRWTVNNVATSILRMLLFFPWCIAVGGSIVLCPKRLDIITFRSGYLDPLSGIYRFAHWVDHAFEHIIIFVSFIGFVFWLNPAIGIVVGCAMGAMIFNAWYDFRLDPSVPLGEDDRQSVYLSLTRFWMTDEFLNLRKVKAGFILDDEPKVRRMDEELEDDES